MLVAKYQLENSDNSDTNLVVTSTLSSWSLTNNSTTETLRVPAGSYTVTMLSHDWRYADPTTLSATVDSSNASESNASFSLSSKAGILGVFAHNGALNRVQGA